MLTASLPFDRDPGVEGGFSDGMHPRSVGRGEPSVFGLEKAAAARPRSAGATLETDPR